MAPCGFEIAQRNPAGPIRIAFFFYDLAANSTRCGTRATARPHTFPAKDDLATTAAKLALIDAVAVVISNGLGILGVTPVEKM